MLKKIINIMFAVVITLTPVLTMAGTSVVLVSEVKNTTLAIEKNVFEDGTEIKVTKVEQEVVRPTMPKEADKTQTSAPINGWLLFSALFSFVLLCNRWTV